MKKSNIKYKLISILFFLGLLGIWQLLASSPRISFLFGSPIDIFRSLITNTLNGLLPQSLVITGFKSITGFLIGIVFGTLIGFLLWYSSKLALIFKPYIIVLGAIPVFAFAPMIIIWFGIGITMKIALSAISVFLVALVQSYEGAQSIDEEEYRLLKIYGATRLDMLKKVIFPSSLSWVLASKRLNIGFAILGAYVGEFISANQGLGFFMIRAGSLYDIPSVLAGGVYLILLALLLNYLVNLIGKNKLKIIEFFG